MGWKLAVLVPWPEIAFVIDKKSLARKKKKKKKKIHIIPATLLLLFMFSRLHGQLWLSDYGTDSLPSRVRWIFSELSILIRILSVADLESLKAYPFLCQHKGPN
jgi:hypothetical protein